ncbi:MAG: substrate-binding domain-containing protein [Pseudomonadota bacterium]
MPPESVISRRAWCLLAGAAAGGAPVRSTQAQPTALRVGGTGAALVGMRLLAPLLERDGITVQIVSHLGTAGGIRAVSGRAVDVALASRPPLPAEQPQMLREYRYARTRLVFATHAATSADSLSHDQAVAMLSGQWTHWPGGERVRASRRPDQDSDTMTLSLLSPAMAEAVTVLQHRLGVVTAASDHDQAEALERLPGTIGVLAESLILGERRALKILVLRDPPEDAARWPMLKNLHVVTRVDARPAVDRFLDRLGSAEAADILSANGHVMQQAAPR